MEPKSEHRVEPRSEPEEAKGLTYWWKRLTGKASQVVGDHEASLARGKTAGATVTDDAGRTIVEVGRRIDNDVLTRARQAGKLAAVFASAMKAQTQDLKDMVRTQYNHTETGQEARLLDSVDDYREARTYRGRILTMDVTDNFGNVVAPAGKEIDEDDVRRVREAGLLSAFLAAAQASLPGSQNGNTVYPTAAYAPPPVRTAPLLVSEDEQSEGNDVKKRKPLR